MNKEKFKVLYIEDNPADYRFVKEILEFESGRFLIENSKDIKSARERLKKGGINAVLLDLSLPDSKAGDSFSVIKDMTADIPVIILTGNDDEKMAIDIMQEGAQDYILKDKLDSYILSRAIIHSIERNSIKRELKDRRERLRMLFENMSEAFAYFREDSPKAEYYIIEEANDVYLKTFGDQESGYVQTFPNVNKRVKEAFDLALKKGHSSVIEYSTESGKWYELRIYRPSKGYIALIANDITDRKENERKSAEQNQLNILRAEIWRIASQIEMGTDSIINEVSQVAGHALGFSRITHNKRFGEEFICMDEWRAKGIKTAIGDRFPASIFQQLLKKGGITQLNRENLEKVCGNSACEKVVLDIISKYGISEMIAMPYFINSKMEGFITFDSCFSGMKKPSDADIKSVVHDIVKIVSQAIVERRIYDELAESRAMYKTLFENMINGFVYCSLDINGEDFTVIETNKAALKIMANEEMIIEGISGRKLMSCCESEFLQIIKKIRLVANSGGNIKFEYYSEGKKKWLYVNAYSTKKGYFALIIEDITERKTTEEKLIRSEERFKTLFETAPFAYFLADMSGKFLDANKKAQALCGYSKEELRNRSYLEVNLIKPNLYAKAAMSIMKLAMGNGIEEEEFKITKKDGSEAEVILSAFPVNIGGNKYILGAAIDITEKKKTEAALGESEKKYKAIFDNIKSGFLYIKALKESDGFYKFIINEANDFAKAVFDFENKDVKNIEAGEFFGGRIRDNETWKYLFGRALKGNSVDPYEFVVVENGKWYSMAVSSPMRDYIVCMIDDITIRKEAEFSLRKSYEKLKEADRMKTSFISMVSHELRTPMTSIKGFTSLIKKGLAGDLNETQKMYLQKIESNSDRMMDLVNDLLDASKMESGIFAVNLEKTDLKILTENEINSMEGVAAKKGIKIKFIAPDKDYPAMADPLRFSQAVSNLLNNAIKFSPEKSEVIVKLEVYKEGMADNESISGFKKSEGVNYMLSVKDFGVGIPKDQVKKVFEKFFQVQDTETREFRGTGLGLSITKNIIEAHNGVIWAESEGNGKGSCFIAIIPGGYGGK